MSDGTEKEQGGAMKAREIRAAAWRDLAAGQYWLFVGGYFVLNVLFGAALVASAMAMVVPIFVVSVYGDPTLTASWWSVLPWMLPGACVATVLLLYGIGFVSWGGVRLSLAAARRELKFEQCLSGWGNGWRMSWTQLVLWTYVQLWMLLFIVPGVVKCFSYAMAPFVQVDHPNWSATQCITASRRLMRGNKWRYFCLNMSFIGWWLLCLAASLLPLAGGLAQNFLVPYVFAAQARFYEEIRGRAA